MRDILAIFAPLRGFCIVLVLAHFAKCTVDTLREVGHSWVISRRTL